MEKTPPLTPLEEISSRIYETHADNFLAVEFEGASFVITPGSILIKANQKFSEYQRFIFPAQLTDAFQNAKRTGVSILTKRDSGGRWVTKTSDIPFKSIFLRKTFEEKFPEKVSQITTA